MPNEFSPAEFAISSDSKMAYRVAGCLPGGLVILAVQSIKSIKNAFQFVGDEKNTTYNFRASCKEVTDLLRQAGQHPVSLRNETLPDNIRSIALQTDSVNLHGEEILDQAVSVVKHGAAAVDDHVVIPVQMVVTNGASAVFNSVGRALTGFAWWMQSTLPPQSKSSPRRGLPPAVAGPEPEPESQDSDGCKSTEDYGCVDADLLDSHTVK
jgi:hypothetical protein